METNDAKWGGIARGLEQIDFPALADDEKSAMPGVIIRTLKETKSAWLGGECSDKLCKRIIRAVGRVKKQMKEWQKLQSRKLSRSR